jgi:hypothetical protein
MVTQDNRFRKLIHTMAPDRTCLSVFMASFLASASLVAMTHTVFINDASANIRAGKTTSSMQMNPVECPTISAASTPSVPTPVTTQESASAIHRTTKKIAASEDKNIEEAKLEQHPIKASKPQQKGKLRMKAIGLQDGVIWAVNKNYDVIRIAVGDEVPGVGTIGVIRSDRTVRTTDGRTVLLEEVN